MADIFISYKHEEQQIAKKLADAFQKKGWTVWWDPEVLTGERFHDIIDTELKESKCVVVLWSKLSVESENVKDEATYALKRKKLVPITIEDVDLPYWAERINTGQLINWDGSDNFPGYQKLVSDITKIITEEDERRRKEAERKAENERRRKQEQERKLREEEQRKAKEERQRLEEEKQRLAEQKRIEATRKAEEERNQKEDEAKRKADEEKRRKEKEELQRKSAEEERKRKEAETKRKIEEEQKHKEIKAEIKPDVPKPVKVKPSKPKSDKKTPTEPRTSKPISPGSRKTSSAKKFAAVAGIIVLLMTGGWFYYKYQQGQIEKETRIKIERFYEQIEELERSAAKADNQEQIKGLYEQRDTLSHQVEGFVEKSTKVGLESQLEQLQDRLKQVQIQLANKEKEFIEVRQEIEKLDSQALDLENAVAKLDKPEQIKEFTRQRNTLSHQVEGFSEQAIKIGMRSQLEQLQNRLERIQIELANKEKELIAARKGPISPQKTITNSIGMKFVLIPAGSFTMGSQLNPEETALKYGGAAEYYKDEQPPHPVEITKPFYLQITEVSQAQWNRVMGNNPSQFKDCGDDCPVEEVSWNDTQKFISKLNQMEDTNKYRLPTEAEWEYACRAETKTPFFTGECISTDQANYNGNNPGKNCPKGEYRGKTVKVGNFRPNVWGLYDMHGNVREWVQDWYGDYPSNSVVDPKGPDKGENRVLRGGSWFLRAVYLRSADRRRDNPGSRSLNNGFRVARDF